MFTRFSKHQNASYTFNNDVIQLSNTPHLFYRQYERAQKQFQRFCAELPLQQPAIDNFQRNIALNADYCKQADIPYVHLVFPAKIPVFHTFFEQAGVTVAPLFSASHELPNVTYPRALLDDPQNDFLIQDTHNSDGGKLKLIRHLVSLLGLPDINNNAQMDPVLFVGDMGKRLNLPAQTEHRFLQFDGLPFQGKTFTTASALKGNAGQIVFNHNPAALHKKRLLLFGDSFIQSCNSILRHLFEDVIYLRTPYIMGELADNLAPDYIITSNAERYLAAVPDANQKKPYFMNYFSPNFTPTSFGEASLQAFIALFNGRNSTQFARWKREFQAIDN